MKYAIIAALFVFALAQGSLAQDASQDLTRITEYLEDAKNKMIEEVNKVFQQNDLAAQAQTMLEGSRTQLEALAPQVEEQLRTVLSTVEEQVKPLQEQMQPLLQNLQREMEALVQKLTEKAKAIAN
ncbi:antifreeze protein type IV [Boleophthalmus pectinirostris]|uniref:antifreeze protein type IV n=1 Tax=Boleophthalmus pectinirostris TaxID=150288 RepID=UPI000A1C6A1D|nr:antifreeze protein type IV [Boleophthalmus pectinirostris]